MKYIFPTTILFALLLSCQPKTADSKTAEESSSARNLAYFKATGNEPSWGLEIGEDGILFTSMMEGLDSVSMPHAEPTRAVDANIKLYNLRTEATQLDIEITQGDCADTMADTLFPYSVKVRVKRTANPERTELQGCGRYLPDQQLTGKWSLAELLGLPLTGEDFANALPYLEIDMSRLAFAGHAGCNRMNGRLFFERGLLRFSDIITTRMACPAMDKETALVKALESTTTYSIEQGRLTLGNPSGVMAVFTAAE